MDTRQLTATLLYDGSMWVVLLERRDSAGYSACQVICGASEPVLEDVYHLLLAVHHTLTFSPPTTGPTAGPTAGFAADASRAVGYKRMQREARRMTEDSDSLENVRAAARAARAEQKAQRAVEQRAEREAAEEYKRKLREEQKKAKHRGR